MASFRWNSRLVGVSENVAAKYIFDIDVKDVRIRQISAADAQDMRSLLLAGNKCRKEFIPQAKGRKKFQLVAGLYGTIIVKQIFKVEGGVGVPVLKTEMAIGNKTESGRFMFFKIYDYPID